MRIRSSHDDRVKGKFTVIQSVLVSLARFIDSCSRSADLNIAIYIDYKHMCISRTIGSDSIGIFNNIRDETKQSERPSANIFCFFLSLIYFMSYFFNNST